MTIVLTNLFEIYRNKFKEMKEGLKSNIIKPIKSIPNNQKSDNTELIKMKKLSRSLKKIEIQRGLFNKIEKKLVSNENIPNNKKIVSEINKKFESEIQNKFKDNTSKTFKKKKQREIGFQYERVLIITAQIMGTLCKLEKFHA